MSSEQKHAAGGDGTHKRAYEKPSIKRVDLALAETLSAGCKVSGDGGECDPDPGFADPTSELGS